MAEIIYEYPGTVCRYPAEPNIRWLGINDYDVFIQHLKLCGQKELDKSVWAQIYENADRYAGYFINGKMVARACVEKYSQSAWEVGDVRTVKEYRNCGYASRLCEFVLQYICENNMPATMRTDEENRAMQKIILRLGFVIRQRRRLFADFYQGE